MLRPSYSELMEVLNQQESIDMKVTSRYTIVIAAAKRARQIIDGSAPMAKASSDKAVSIAINEMHEGRLTVCVSQDETGIHAIDLPSFESKSFSDYDDVYRD